MYITSKTHENGKKEFYLMDYDSSDNYNAMLKILKEDFHMTVKDEFAGLFTYRTSLESDGYQYDLIWDEDLGNSIYCISQDEEAVSRLGKILEEAKHKINHDSRKTRLEFAAEKEKKQILVTLINESNYEYFDNFIPDYYKDDSNMTYLGIILEDIAIGAMLFQKLESMLYIHWIYISQKYRRFHYASQALKELISKMEDLGAVQIVGLVDAAGENIDAAADFFLSNGFKENIKNYDFYSLQLEDLFHNPQLIKLMEKKISDKIISLSEAEELALKHWNNRYFKIEKRPEYEEYSFLFMDKGEIAGVLLGKKENDTEYLLETLYCTGQDSIYLLDLILKFIHTVKETGREKSIIKIVVIDSKMEQLVKKMFGVEMASGQVPSYTYEYNL